MLTIQRYAKYAIVSYPDHYDGSEACRHANSNLDVFRTIVCAVLRFRELFILLARHKVAMEYQLIFRKQENV